LDLLVPPVLVKPPSNLTVLVGEDATFTVTITNTGTLPVGYRWSKEVVVTNMVLDALTCAFTLYNVQANSTSTNGPGSYQLRVTNRAGSDFRYFSLTVVTASPPEVTTLTASGLTTNEATLNGTVNPKWATTTAWFDYGLTPSYGSSTATTDVGNGSNAVAVAFPIGGLSPGTNYHYRIAATNIAGTTLGNDMTFQTVPSLPPEPTIGHCARLANSHFQLHFNGQPGATYTVEVSMNLTNWTAIGVATETAPGVFEFTDTDAPTHESCYYRLRSP